jgi:hypothetical protein
MLDSGLLISWGEVYPGRTQQVVRLFSDVVAYHDKLLKEGRISGFEPCVLGTHGGGLRGLTGFMIVRGTPNQIISVRHDDEFLANVLRAEMLIKDVGVDQLFLGEAVRHMMAPIGP